MRGLQVLSPLVLVPLHPVNDRRPLVPPLLAELCPDQLIPAPNLAKAASAIQLYLNLSSATPADFLPQQFSMAIGNAVLSEKAR